MLQIELDEDSREVELGKGAFGVVVKGRYRLSPVAVKRLINQTPEQQAQFLKEMAILRACRGSRYIVPFVGASLQPVSADSLLCIGALICMLRRACCRAQPARDLSTRMCSGTCPGCSGQISGRKVLIRGLSWAASLPVHSCASADASTVRKIYAASVQGF